MEIVDALTSKLYLLKGFFDKLKAPTYKSEPHHKFWSLVKEYDLSVPRTREPIDEAEIQVRQIGPGNYVYPKLMTGTATIHFDTLSTGYPLANYQHDGLKHWFNRVFITNTAQPGKWLTLFLGSYWWDIAPDSISPMDLQAQYRPIICSTTTPLIADDVYNSGSYDIRRYSWIDGLATADVASAANGLQIQQSMDGTNWDGVTQWFVPPSPPAITGFQFSVRMVSGYVRVVFTNGAANQNFFRLEARARAI